MANSLLNKFEAGSSAIPATSVELSVSCRKLVDMDVFSKSDPMVVLYIKEFGSQTYREIGRTEMVKDNPNPDFVKKFVLDYFFEESQRLKFEVYDVDSTSRDLRQHDYLGMMECSLAEIATQSVLTRAIKGPKTNSGSMIAVNSEELSSSKEEVTLQMCGKKLDKKDFFGKSDPFLAFSKVKEDGSYVLTYRTEVIKNTLNPTWKAFTVPVRLLCNGDYDRSIKVECFDWDSDGSHEYIGEFLTTMRELSRGHGPSNVYDCINVQKQKKKKKGYKNSGIIEVLDSKVVPVYSFLDYVKGGTQINCTIAIDFTASNGNPTASTSLHYMSPYQPNQYSQALSAVGEIIRDYDTDQLFPALGFGAKFPNGTVSHEFFLNGNPTNPYCQGIEGVMAAYQQALHSVQLYGPTNFAPVINHVGRFAASAPDGSQYFILLILTDGVITDMPQTKEAIVNASSLPMSIIIVGIGNAEFDAMEELDGDDVKISSKGRYAERDIVQFVPFREFMNQSFTPQAIEMNKARLAKEVLAEIPDQFISYMKKIAAKPRTAAPNPNFNAVPGAHG